MNWIPCDKELPQFTSDYLVTVGINSIGMGMHNEIRVALYHTINKRWYVYESEKKIIGEPLAWSELPVPYKEGKVGNHIITEEEIAIEKLNRALNDYLQDQETASQMEEAITYAVKILAGIVEEGQE